MFTYKSNSKVIGIFLVIILSAIMAVAQTVDDVVDDLDDLTVNMVYISEIDSPLTAFRLYNPVVSLNKRSYVEACECSLPRPIVQLDADVFFEHQIDIHPNEGWEDLQIYMETHLKQIIVVRAGTTAPEYCVVGLYLGYPVGFKFNAVET